MMRFRRYRVFATLSFVILLLLYKSSSPANWDLDWRDTPPGSGYASKVPAWHRDPESYRNQLETDIKVKGGNTQEKPLSNVDADKTEQRPKDETPKNQASETPLLLDKTAAESPAETPSPKGEDTESAVFTQESTTSTPAVAEAETDIPTIPKPHPGGQHEIQWPSEGDQVAIATPTPIHWEPQEEHFPLSPDEIISLPTASAQPIPRIQFKFGKEDAEAKATREKRLAEVKAEMQHAWKGYSKYAWGHDELMPVSLSYKDPFCGWAATLVDSLDTLWIMGMTEEFDKAVNAVGEIDFTYSPYRPQIPVFETTIRYLGGLLGAYDISGGVSVNKDYGVLLDKAGELAEILMGIFDTPNRMPILYYDYKPQYVSRPKMAPTQVGVAELGSLLMEFTRLAQLSGTQKYYDAVARITNALDDLGQRGTAYPGLFPESLDVSGCNRTVPENKQEDKEVNLVVPGLNPSVSKNHGRQHDGGASNGEDANSSHKIKERDVVSENLSVRDNVQKVPNWPAGSSRSPPSDLLKDCRPQPIVTSGLGSDSYSIGGSQDSTYEYFPKEYLLLGGKEDQYRRLSIDTLEATKNHLLFRPMTYDERDILFSAKIVERHGGNPEYIFESTHLTCFVGGMFGMAAKIFDNDEYLDLGKRLTDGCVWAYESFPSGIMPEDSRVVPCRDPTSCPWNETLWHDWIDPMVNNRDKSQQEYDERHALTLAQEKADEEAAKAKAAEEEAAAKKAKVSEVDESEVAKKEEAAMKQANHFASVAEAEAARQAKLIGKDPFEMTNPTPVTGEHMGNTADKLIGETYGRPESHSEKMDVPSSDGDTNTAGTAKQAESETPRKEGQSLRRREIPSEAVDTAVVSTLDVTGIGGSAANGVVEKLAPKDEDEDELLTPAPKTKEEAEALAANPPPPPPAQQNVQNIKESSTESQQPLVPYDPETDPFRPLNHSQFVAKRIEDEKLPKGFVSIPGRHYILRPEAIESVWYMYRITGDKTWQEKGWRMFRSIIKATKTEAGHSAIADITNENSEQNDSMESFWLAETLKYFYLLFAEPDVVSLDDWVLNTEAHPFRRLKSQTQPQASVESRPLDE